MTRIIVNKRILTILFASILIGILVVVAFYKLYSFSTARPDPPTPSYIGDSRIFLLSASSSYGFNYLTPCFILHLTIRNDYTPQNPVDNETGGVPGSAWFILHAVLYDRNGKEISSQAFIPPFGHPNYYQEELDSVENMSLTIYAATSSHDVDHYTLVFGWLGSFPAP